MEDGPFPLEPDENSQYFDEHSLHIYFKDGVSQMLSLLIDNTKVKPTKFFREYFCSVHQGTHVLFREYAFISATLYNRLCVVKAVMQIFKPLLYKEEKQNAHDYHSLLQLVWPDIPIDIIHCSFASFDSAQSNGKKLSFLDFIRALKCSFCSGDLDYEANIINMQLIAKIEEFSKLSKLGEKLPNSTEFDFLCLLDDSDKASSWSIASALAYNNGFRRMLALKASNSFSSDDPLEVACGKLSRSSSGSKDASKSEQNVSTFSRASSASLRGRLSGKQLSNSLTLLQTEKFDTENFQTKRHRSKSAVAIQRDYHSARS